MPRYYQYGYQGPAYAYNWEGIAPRAHQAGELRALSGASRNFGGPPAGTPPGPLGDVTDLSNFFTIPPSESPYYLHKAGQQLPYFTVPPSKSPYYLHKYGPAAMLSAPVSGLGDVIPGVSNRMLMVGAAAAAAWFLFLRKPKRKNVARSTWYLRRLTAGEKRLRLAEAARKRAEAARRRARRRARPNAGRPRRRSR